MNSGELFEQMSALTRQFADHLMGGRHQLLLDEYFWPECVCVAPGKEPFKANDGMMAMFKEMPCEPGVTLDAQCKEVRTEGAWVYSLCRIVFSKDGQAIKVFNGFHLWEKRGDEWRRIYDMWN